MNLFDAFIRGGLTMYLVMLCLIVMVYCAIERLLALHRAQIDVGQFMMKVRNTLRSGDIDAVLAFCPQSGAPITNIIRRGAAKHDLGIEGVRDAMEDAAREEVYHLGRRLPMLESIARVAPMLGLLGGLTGMAGTFLRIESVGRAVSQADVVDGILVAVIAGGFGLAVGVPASLIYTYLKVRVARLGHEMDLARMEFLDLLQEARRAEKPLPVQADATPPRYVAKPAATLVFDDDLYFRKKR